jgi:FkbM family methyltransferase
MNQRALFTSQKAKSSMMRSFLEEVRGINLIDIGCSEGLDKKKWLPIQKHINLVGFDPRKEECERLSALPHEFHSAQYLPYAVGGANQHETLYKVKRESCWSLLKPNAEWVRRFSFGDMFDTDGTETVQTQTLDSIREIVGVDIDVIKIDTQGMELPILSHGTKALEQSFYVETETGFVENYEGETTYSEIDPFMRERGYLLFDMNLNHRVSRDNLFRKNSRGEQILWCEAVWLKDYVAMRKRGSLKEGHLNRPKALKGLILCAVQGCISFGYELACLFRELGFISAQELAALGSEKNWAL